MADGTSSSPQFVMVGAREVVAEGMSHIERQVVAIEEAVSNNPGLAFDLSKTVIESICKSILKDRGHSYDEAWDLPKLLKETTGKIRLIPDSCIEDPDVAARLKKTLGGLQTTIQGICEMRNTHGFASHGKDALSPQLDHVHALLVARSADAIVNFLFHAHRDYNSFTSSPRLAFDDHTDFNDYVDDENEVVQIFEVGYRPSEVLFAVDQDAYRNYLTNYAPEVEEMGQPPPQGERVETVHE